jgi:8-amino-7-oxononanoate synthase
MPYLQRVEAELNAIRSANRYRRLASRQLDGVIDFSSNDYLGLSTEPQVVEALKRATRAGSGGARLLGVRHREHALLEEELAEWLGRERALLFSSGYLAAIGAIPALARVFGRIFSDELNHASLIDGVRLARVPRTVYRHRRLGDAAQRHPAAPPSLAVSESLFGMDGDAVDPGALLDALGEEDALFLDEAHALGVVGEQGAGLARDLRDPRLIVMGTLSKSLGALGGFVAGPGRVIELLVNAARGFIFDTALPPAVVLAARVALHLARRAGDRRERLKRNAARLRDGLRRLGFGAGEDACAIVPLILGSEERALESSARLLQRKIYAPAIRPPTVPPGGSRLRFSVRSDHTAEQIDYTLEQLPACIATS